MSESDNSTNKTEKSKDTEIERKYLVNEEKWPEIRERLGEFDFIDISQGYDPSGLRIRKSVYKSGKVEYILADKSTVLGTGGLVKTERETILSEIQFRVLWPATEGIRIEKRRYFIPQEENMIHLDLFNAPDQIKDKKIIEVEFPSIDKAKSFLGNEPTWFGDEITEKTTNHKLALGQPFPTH